MNVAGEPEDIGVSRYPPAEGERGSQRGPFSRGGGAEDTGVSRYPPAEGERTVPSGERVPPPVTEPNENEDAAGLPEPITTNGAPAGSTTPKRRNDERGRVDPTIAGGSDLSLAGLPDGAHTRAGIAVPSPELARLFPRPDFSSIGVRQEDTGVSRYPPAEGERSSPSAPAPSIDERQGDTGVSRYPPAEGERNAPSGEQRPQQKVSWYSSHEHATVVTQAHNLFPAPYSGRNSLLPREGPATSLTSTLFWAGRLWEHDHGDGQLIFDPELAGGTGFSRTSGIAGFPNFEITRVGIPKPTPYVARLYLRQTFGFGGEREFAPDAVD
jgi:hypothetical protein